MARIRALNLGCGPDYRESTDEIEWVNVDNGICKCDILVDIEEADRFNNYGMFDRIDAVQVLEHISKENFGRVIKWMYDISNEGAIWEIVSPHGFSDNFITDPTHKMPFSLRTFDYFIDGTPLRELGVIYGWGPVSLEHVYLPQIDGNQSVHFTLRVR